MTADATQKLITAILNQDSQSAENAVRDGADVNASCAPHENNLLNWAVMNNDATTANVLVKGHASLNARDRIGNTPLINAMMNKTSCIDAVKVLIHAGADINAQNKGGNTALMYAIKNNDFNAATVIANAGALFHLENKYGKTAKIIAFESNFCLESYFELEKASKQKSSFSRHARPVNTNIACSLTQNSLHNASKQRTKQPILIRF